MPNPRITGFVQPPPQPEIGFDTPEDVHTWHDYFLRQQEIIQQLVNIVNNGVIEVDDEGNLVTADARFLNFTGAGVTAVASGVGANIDIPGSAGGVDVQDEGVPVVSGATFLNFIGTPVTATPNGTGANVTVANTGPLWVDVWGSRRDGAVTLDGATTPSWATRAGSVYAMTANPHCTTLTINNGITLNYQTGIIYCESLVNNGTINGAGGNGGAGASVGTSGGGPSAYYLNPGGQGGGGVSTNNNGGGASTVTQGFGGIGGAGGNSGGAFVGGALNWTPPPTSAGGLNTAWALSITSLQGRVVNNSAGGVAVAAGGGGGSGGGNVVGSGASGAGGGGGGFMLMFCKEISGTGTITVNGGNGGNANAGGAGQSGGGGGGGGGFIIIWTTTTSVPNTVTANAGTGGNSAGGVGATNGANGNPGFITYFLVPA